MSNEKNQASQLSLLEQLKLQRAQFASQKDLAQNNLNQLVGAVFACDEMIKKHENDAKIQDVSDEGEQGNGETVDKEQVETTKE